MLATQVNCRLCGHLNRPTAWSCSECGHALQTDTEFEDPTKSRPRPSEPEEDQATRAERRRAATLQPLFLREDARTDRAKPSRFHNQKRALIAIAIGALLCWLDSLGGIPHVVLGFLATLTHEIGHAATATLLGAPSFPVIRPGGHAAALHSGQSELLALGIWLFFGYMAWTLRREDKPWRTMAGIAAAYPLLAFTGIWEWVFLLAGHGGELAFAGWFLWRAIVTGRTHSKWVRYAYASLGLFLAMHCALFHARLLMSVAFRAEYHHNGSFGLENDYIRVARDHFGVALETVAGGMLLLNVVALPLCLWLMTRRR